MVVPHAGTWIEIFLRKENEKWKTVVPHAGTWIEIVKTLDIGVTLTVVPHAGTWIEIAISTSQSNYTTSFPTRERGLK